MYFATIIVYVNWRDEGIEDWAWPTRNNGSHTADRYFTARRVVHGSRQLRSVYISRINTAITAVTISDTALKTLSLHSECKGYMHASAGCVISLRFQRSRRRIYCSYCSSYIVIYLSHSIPQQHYLQGLLIVSDSRIFVHDLKYFNSAAHDSLHLGL